MLNLADMELVASLAGGRSLAETARRMNVTPSAVTQRLQGVEARVGMRLVNRYRGRFSLTEEGKFLAVQGRQMLDALDRARETLAERRRLVVGRISVAAPFGFGRRYVAPLVASFRADHPDLIIDLTLSDRPATLHSAAYDVAFHVGALDAAADSLNVQKIASNVRIVCASPDYVAQRGAPSEIEELFAHDCIALHENSTDGALWRLRPTAGGSEKQVRIKPSLATNDGDVAKSWAADGLGLVLRSEWDVADDLRSGRLQRVLKQYTSAAWDIMALLPAPSDTRPARVQLFLDRALAAFAPSRELSSEQRASE